MGEAIKELLINLASGFKDRDDLEAGKRAICKKYSLAAIPNVDILKEYRLLLSQEKIGKIHILESILRKRAIRTLSGIAPVAVLTKPYPCPGECAYCPHEQDVPTSYLSNEPAVMRAIRCDYDPYKQVALRLKALENNGHEPTKIELIVIGGTWSYLPTKYKYWYIVNCFRASNDFAVLRKKVFKAEGSEEKYNNNLKPPYSKNLSLQTLKEALIKEQKKNEKATYNLIGVTLETRPDYLDEAEVREMRILGATRVEIGVQAIDDEILKLNKRGHGVKEVVEATRLLKEYGFKVTYHLMPALPGATPKKDLSMFKQLFNDERFQPDQIKFYPTVVTAGSLLYRWFKAGKYKPYSDKVLQELIVKCKALVPPYVRIIRLIRDIPGESIIAGNKITNLRQIMKDRGVKCCCIRCREAKEQVMELDYEIRIIKYPASQGIEYFISAESRDAKTLYGFCRLRIDNNSPIAPAMIRELHVYGVLVSVGGDSKVQHSGLGKRLMMEAESIAMDNDCQKMAVISGVGVRGYYKKLGYKLQDTYIVKRLGK